MKRGRQNLEYYLDFDYRNYQTQKQEAQKLIEEIISFGQPQFKLPSNFQDSQNQLQVLKQSKAVETSQSSLQRITAKQKINEVSQIAQPKHFNIPISQPNISLIYKGHQITFALESVFKSKTDCLWVPCLNNNIEKLYPVKQLYKKVIDRDLKKYIKKHLEKCSMRVTSNLKLQIHNRYLLFRVEQTESIQNNPQIIRQGTKQNISKLIERYKIDSNQYLEAFNMMIQTQSANIAIPYLTEQISNDSSRCQLHIIFKILKAVADQNSDFCFNIKFCLQTIDKFRYHLHNAKKFMQVCMSFSSDIQQNFEPSQYIIDY